MRLTKSKVPVLKEKEIKLLHFVHEFGFCEMKQIMRQFAIKKSIAYSRMEMLTRLGFVKHLYMINGRSRAYCLTHKGISSLELDLPPVKKIQPNHYEHHLSVMDVYLRLKALHPDTVWITERRLMKQYHVNSARKSEHRPDSVLIFSDGKQCAIEVELSLKMRGRLKEIVFGYGLQDIFKEVWYFCLPNIIPVINEIARDLPYVKTYNLTEFLP